LSVVWRLEWLWEVGSLLVDHLDDHTHGLRDDQNVGEDDGGIDKAFITFDGLESQGRGDLGCAAAFEEVTASLCFVVLREVAASYWREKQMSDNRSGL
jgi:hypothetical protein